MLAEAVRYGLAVDHESVTRILGFTGTAARPDPRGPLHRSLIGFWQLMELVPHRYFDAQSTAWRWRPNLGRRYIPADALIHESVLVRGERFPPLPSSILVERTEAPWPIEFSRR